MSLKNFHKKFNWHRFCRDMADMIATHIMHTRSSLALCFTVCGIPVPPIS